MVVHRREDINMLEISKNNHNESAINKKNTKEMAYLQVLWKKRNIGYKLKCCDIMPIKCDMDG